MKITLVAALAAIAFSCAAVQARETNSIVVESSPSPLALWSAEMTSSIDGVLESPRGIRSASMNGIVSLRFVRAVDGSASEVKVVRSSGFWDLNRAALSAIGNIIIPPLPAGMRSGQVFEASILFASSQRSHDQQIRRLQRDASDGNAWQENSDIPFVLGPVTRSDG